MKHKKFEDEPPATRAKLRLLGLIRASDIDGNASIFDPWPLAEADPAKDLKRWSELHTAREVAEKAWRGSPLRSPRHQVFAAEHCVSLREAIEKGDGGAVLEAAAQCAAHGLVMPAWLAVAYVERFQAVMMGDAKDWNDKKAFGRAFRKGANVAGIRATAQIAPWAYEVATQLLEANPKRPIDAGFYSEVGEIVGIKQTHAQKLIKAHLVRADHFPPLKFLKDKLGEGQTLPAAMSAWSSLQHDKWLRSMGYVETVPGEWVAVETVRKLQ